MAIRVAATLRIADHIAAGVTTAPALAETVKPAPDALGRLLRHLVTKGVLADDRAGGFALTAVGEELRRESGRLDMDDPLGRADISLVHLTHAVRTGTAAFPVLYGREFWDDLSADPERTAAYAKLMGVDAADWAPSIVEGFGWASLGHLVDVGGGNGTLLAAILTAHPALRGTVVDLAGPVEEARATFADAGLADRADAVVGSFFEPLPVTGAGGYLLCAITHDWDDDSARTILRRCAEAAGSGGRVFVVEKSASPDTGMDLLMLAYFGARERGLTGLAALAQSAGLRVVAVHPAGDTPIVELR